MGVESSTPSIPPNKKSILLSGKNVYKFPFSVPEDFPIKKIDVSDNNIKTFPTKLLNVSSIDVSKNDLKDVLNQNPEVVFEFPNLEILKMSDCNLESMPEFVKSFKNIKELHIEKNHIEQIEVPFEKIETLNVFLNKIKTLSNLPLSLLKLNAGFNLISDINFSLPNLVELRLQGNNISNISPNISFPNVKFLDLSHNHLYELPSVARMAPKVEMLQLTYNFLVESPKDLPISVQKLDISYNSITHISCCLVHLVNMNHLDISHNLIDELPPLPPNIKSLFTEFNEFKKVYPIENRCLKTITFYSSKLTDIPDLSKTKVKTLVLAHNEICDMQNPRNIPTSVKQLDFIANKLVRINPEFLMYKSLTTLNITGNYVKEIPESIKDTHLMCLMVAQNPISSLPPLPETLTTISCANCLFTSIPESLATRKGLVHVDFSCNSLTKCPTISTTLLNISCNNIKTVGTVSPHTAFYLASNNKIKDIRFHAVNLLSYLDISHNDVRELKLSPGESVRTLKLGCNPQLAGEINFKNFPNLDHLDVTGTKLNFVNYKNTKVVEIARDYVKSSEKTGDTAIKNFHMDKNVGYFEFIGVRPTMEDAIIIRNIGGDAKLLGVLDGHGGSRVASLGAYFIPHEFGKLGDNYTIQDIQTIVNKLNKQIEEFQLIDGATMVLAIIRGMDISIGHLGDARALIVREDGSCVELTVDHKATDRMECDILKERHCYLALGRVNGMLAVSRTIGDMRIPGVIRCPALTTYQIKPGDKRILLACDGIFDVFTNEEAASIVMSEKDPARAASRLVSLAYARGSQDNMSALVYDFPSQSFLSKLTSLF